MIQKIKMLMVSLTMSLSFVVPAAVPATVHAVDADIEKSLCGGADQLKFGVQKECKDLAGGEDTGLNAALGRIINIISVIVGVVAVVMIIFGGFRYITSGGTSEKVTNAKNTILYGIIGLVIVALAQVIVRFVLRESTT